jgi:hypothetical protein
MTNDEETAQVCARIPAVEKREFQKACIDEGVMMQDKVRELIRRWMQE